MSPFFSLKPIGHVIWHCDLFHSGCDCCVLQRVGKLNVSDVISQQAAGTSNLTLTAPVFDTSICGCQPHPGRGPPLLSPLLCLFGALGPIGAADNPAARSRCGVPNIATNKLKSRFQRYSDYNEYQWLSNFLAVLVYCLCHLFPELKRRSMQRPAGIHLC